MNIQAQRDISLKLKVFEHAPSSGNVAFTCRHFGISRETTTSGSELIWHMGSKGLSIASPAQRIPSCVLRHSLKNTQQNAIDSMDYVIAKFPFRINTVRTDNGHEFQVKFHWHLEDLGIRHAYIKPRTPRLNGKVERSRGTDQREFYQLLTYKDDVDLSAKLAEWEAFYNYHRPHGSLDGKTPYERLVEKMR